MFRVLKAAVLYGAVIVIGLLVVASTEVVSLSGSAGVKDIAIAVAAKLRSYLGPVLGPASDQPPGQTEDRPELPAASVPVEPASAASLPPVRQSVEPPQLAAACGVDAAASDRALSAAVVIGDRLRIRIFEQAAFPMQTAPEGTAPVPPPDPGQVVFERLDLSGIYEVDQGGEVSLPLLGRLQVFEKSLVCVESLVVVRYFDLTRTQALVNAAFEARLPVTVAGAVRAPGVYAWSPGLTVGNLVARTGITTDGGPDTLSRRTSLRARRSELEALALGVEIEQRRLEADLDQRATLDLTPAEFQRATARLGARRVENETAALLSDLAAEAVQDERDAAEVEGLTRQSAELETQDALVASQIATLYSRRDELTDYRQRGFAVAAQLDGIIATIMASERSRQEIQGRILALGLAQRTAAIAGKLRASEHRQRLTTLIRDSAEDADALAAQLATNLAELGLLAGGSAGRDGSAQVVLTLDRQRPDGPVQRAATPTTPLLPGDVLTAAVRLTLAQAGPGYKVSDLEQMLVPVSDPVAK